MADQVITHDSVTQPRHENLAFFLCGVWANFTVSNTPTTRMDQSAWIKDCRLRVDFTVSNKDNQYKWPGAGEPAAILSAIVYVIGVSGCDLAGLMYHKKVLNQKKTNGVAPSRQRDRLVEEERVGYLAPLYQAFKPPFW